jgi:hypothetical protein
MLRGAGQRSGHETKQGVRRDKGFGALSKLGGCGLMNYDVSGVQASSGAIGAGSTHSMLCKGHEGQLLPTQRRRPRT